jgi:hypothetical protein
VAAGTNSQPLCPGLPGACSPRPKPINELGKKFAQPRAGARPLSWSQDHAGPRMPPQRRARIEQTPSVVTYAVQTRCAQSLPAQARVFVLGVRIIGEHNPSMPAEGSETNPRYNPCRCLRSGRETLAEIRAFGAPRPAKAVMGGTEERLRPCRRGLPNRLPTGGKRENAAKVSRRRQPKTTKPAAFATGRGIAGAGFEPATSGL